MKEIKALRRRLKISYKYRWLWYRIPDWKISVRGLHCSTAHVTSYIRGSNVLEKAVMTMMVVKFFRVCFAPLYLQSYCCMYHYASFLFIAFNYYIWLIFQNLSVCTPWFHSTVTSSCSRIDLSMCEYQFSAISVHNFLHAEWCRYVTYLLFCSMQHSNVKWSVVSLCSLHSQHLLLVSSFKMFFLK
jgi:hypothetical protein